MTKNLDNEGLKSIINNYDLFFIDLWGVIHNGIDLYKGSVDVLQKLTDKKKEIVLLTNAPRPNNNVIDFLKRMGLDQKFSSKVYTSGEAALLKVPFSLSGGTKVFCGLMTSPNPPNQFIWGPRALLVETIASGGRGIVNFQTTLPKPKTQNTSNPENHCAAASLRDAAAWQCPNNH